MKPRWAFVGLILLALLGACRGGLSDFGTGHQPEPAAYPVPVHVVSYHWSQVRLIAIPDGRSPQILGRLDTGERRTFRMRVPPGGVQARFVVDPLAGRPFQIGQGYFLVMPNAEVYIQIENAERHSTIYRAEGSR